MKRILLILSVVIFFSCSEENVTPPDASDIASVEQSAATGDWIITYYYDDEDETSDYQGYVFTFSEDGKIEAIRGSSTYNGRWWVERDDDDDDDDDDEYELEFNISFNGPDELEELEDDWYIKSYSDTRLELVDDDDDDDDEILILERN